MATLHNFTGEEIIATELPSLLNQNFEYVNDNRIKTVNNVGYDENNNIDVTHLVTQPIQSGTDLNNLTTSGEYIRLGSVTKLLNSPSESPFFLTVLSSNNLVKQVLTELIATNPATFTRTMNSANWSPWVESGANIGTWESNEQVKVGDVRYVGGRDYTGYVLECVQAGTTGDSQPTISTGDIDNSTDLEGFSGTLQIAHGGTGATTVAGARNNLGLGNTTGALPVANGGTGATTAEVARANLGLSYATQAEAEGGTDNTKVMTPLRVKQEMLKYPAKSLPAKMIVYKSKTVQEIRDYLDSWLNQNLSEFSTLSLQLDNNWYELWNKEDLTTVTGGTGITAGTYCVQNITPYGSSLYTRLLVSCYYANTFFTITRFNGKWGSISQIFTDSRIATQAQAEAGTDNITVMTPLRVNEKLTQWIRGSYIELSPKTIEQLRNKILEYATSSTKNTFLVSMDAVWISEWNAERITQAFGNGQTWTITITERVNGNYFSFEIGTYFTNESGYAARTKWRGSYFNGSWSKLSRFALNGWLSMPSSNFIEVDTSQILINNSDWQGFWYLAPADGWFIYNGGTAENSYAQIKVEENPYSMFGSGSFIRLSTPVGKGQYAKVNYRNLTTRGQAWFVYAQSEV